MYFQTQTCYVMFWKGNLDNQLIEIIGKTTPLIFGAGHEFETLMMI